VDPRPSDEEIKAAARMGQHRGSKTIHTTGTFHPFRVRLYESILSDIYGECSTLDGRRWLDIGSGHGEFLMALQRFSNGALTCKGLEPNIQKQRSARQRGLDIGYFELDEHTGRYDTVSLLNVYSHLPDPPAAISSWKRLLKPKGELLLETADSADFSSDDLIRPFWLPDHLSFASEKIVTGILERTGFEIVSVHKYPVFQPSARLFAKEIAKLILPGQVSSLKYVLKHKLYADKDMYIRARLVDHALSEKCFSVAIAGSLGRGF
jgi:SAM-dependent methyltransferase